MTGYNLVKLCTDQNKSCSWGDGRFSSNLSYLSAISIIMLILSPLKLLGSQSIRINQLGYLENDLKIAVVVSSDVLPELAFQIINNDNVAFRGYLSADKGIYLAHAHHYLADFSSLNKKGRYRLRTGSVVSSEFEINDNLYRSLPDSILRFFAIQRCGNTSPILHKPCHLMDASGVKAVDRTSPGFDLTGGWHDAGDYIKFTLTTAYSTHLLLLTYQLFPDLFKKWVFFELPAPVAEGKIGLDWLMKAHPSRNRLISQVQDVSDHEVGWRLPEADPLAGNRLAWEYSSKATAGSAAAALALGATVFTQLGDRLYATKCLEHAIEIFALSQSNQLPDQEYRPDSLYYDGDPRDNLALAGIELFRATGESKYLTFSKQFIDTLGAGGWISWGDVQGIAAFRLAEHYPAAREYLEIALHEYQTNADKNPYNYPSTIYPWGSLSLQTGVGIMAVLFEIAGGDAVYQRLAVRQRDAIFGANPYGISYFSGVGENYAKHFHNQISYLKKIPLPGGISEGPISRKEFLASAIHLELPDIFLNLHSEPAVYHDDPRDYLTNEPTIAASAQAFFLLSWYANGARLRKE